MAMIETKNLTKSYGKYRGITNLNLSVEQGEFFGFIGPNGAGKSTTIRTLLGFISPTSGTAQVLGESIVSKRKYLNKIGYMPSEAMFYNGMRVSDIITFSANLRKMDCSKEAKVLCDAFDLDTKKRVEELSLGNRKKVAIVCAMQHKPDLYIFDEPTSGLDPLMQKQFFDLLKTRNKEGATIFFSSHVLSEVQHHCTKAAIIKEGRLIAEDRMENLAKTNTKRISLRGIQALPETIQAKSIQASDNGVSFLYKGDVKELILKLGNLDFSDLTITEPELEEVFLHYYEKEGK